VKPAPQCAPQSKDAETCKKSKSEIFAVTSSLIWPHQQTYVQLM